MAAGDGMVENGTSSNVRNVRPPIVVPAPSMWDHLLSTIVDDQCLQVPEKYVEDIESSKKLARNMLLAEASTKKVIVLVDALERLGLAYHFETEIEQKLDEVYDSGKEDHDLFTTSLRFRLLRQHQRHVSCSVFDIFVDEDGKFKEALSSDVEGLLSLYEAAHVRFHNENILDEALVFATHHLSRMVPELESPLKDKVQRALQHSLHRGILILNVPSYISNYARDDSRDELLLQLAKLNFKLLQNIYRKELSQLLRWWEKFELKTKLPYARDRIVECYLWGTTLHFEPQYSFVRVEVAKNMQMVSTMDDTYDNYATLEEAQLFTQILQRWNLEEIGPLPDYMKVVYRFIMSVFDEFEREAAKREKLFAVPYYKEAVKQLGRAYNQEQIWIMERQMPPFEEYISNSVITSCMYVMFGSLLPGIQSVTKETVDWLLSEPKIVISTARMGRHLEDLGSHQRENREGQFLTVVDCYMKDRGVSKEEALSEFGKLVEDGWKDANEEWVEYGSKMSREMIEQILNYGRAAEVTYKNGEDGYSYPHKFLGPQIAALFVDPLL